MECPRAGLFPTTFPVGRECRSGERTNGVPAAFGSGPAHLLEEAGLKGVGGRQAWERPASGKMSVTRGNHEVPAGRAWRAPVIPTLGRWRLEDQQVKVILDCETKLAWAT